MAAPRVHAFRDENEVLTYIADRVSGLTGVQLGERHKTLVQGRLARRMRELNLSTISEYGRHLLAHEQEELGALTSLLTTHHTYFFREFAHFEFLLSTTLPGLIAHHRAKGLKTIRIWSAACSRGQEVYSLAMYLRSHLPRMAPEMDFRIVGSDVDPESVEIARNGVYPWQEIKSVPAAYLHGNWQRGTGEISEFVRAKDELRRHCEFKTVNLLDFDKTIGQSEFDAIFCRNVFIYFSREDITRITQGLLKRLSPSGHLFVGMSESLNGLDLPVEWAGPSVYIRKGNMVSVTPSPSSGAKPVANVPLAGVQPSAGSATPRPPVQAARPLRVVCVDDSKTVLMLLARILTKELGFEVVGTAANGLEAAKVIREQKPDVVTLDIHMPQMTGVEYLQSHFGSGHPPVVMVSSVSREDSALGFRCIELGASDYVEKPTLEKLTEQGEEIRAKLKSAVMLGGTPVPKASERIEASFKSSAVVKDAQKKLRVIVGPLARKRDVEGLMTSFQAPHPPLIVIVEGGGTFTDWQEKLPSSLRTRTRSWSSTIQDLEPGAIYLVGMEAASTVSRLASSRPTSILVVGETTTAVKNLIRGVPSAHVLVEDLGSGKNLTGPSAVPLTSFSYESDRFLAGRGTRS